MLTYVEHVYYVDGSEALFLCVGTPCFCRDDMQETLCIKQFLDLFICMSDCRCW